MGAVHELWMNDLHSLVPDVDDDLLAAEMTVLERGYSEPGRAYHTLQHLVEMFAALQQLEDAAAIDASGARLARVAAWYHDLAYDPRAQGGSNEHRSASLARDHLHRLGGETEDVDVVESLILMTVTHDPGAAARHTPVVDAFHDADLWILSAPTERYAQYGRQVRQEYGHVPEPLFRAGRAEVLSSFARRQQLYRTEHAQQQWSDRARRNLDAELQELTGGV